jgi:hypothetical protein
MKTRSATDMQDAKLYVCISLFESCRRCISKTGRPVYNWILLVSVQVHQILELKGASIPHRMQNVIPALHCPRLIYDECS